MSATDWRFLIDENTSRKLAQLLEERGYHAAMVVDALDPGVGDREDIVPYAVSNDYIIVTKNIDDFFGIDHSAHRGIIGIERETLSAYQYATAISKLVDDFGDRRRFQAALKLDRYL
jgi:hypothetical protein